MLRVRAFLLFATPDVAADISGRASVVDGDTIEISGERIRLNGVDAPESRQTCTDAVGREYRCGKDAAFALDEFLAASRPTICVGVGKDRYKRVIADCERADGASVNAWLVANGWALDWVKYSKGKYASEQAAAKSGRLGIWRGEFQLPCEFRAKGGRAKC